MLTCAKTYRDIPIAHRQHRHDGHCALIHGHNWTFTLTFACDATDANGFVVDFGELRFLKDWIDENLDHACLFNADDPEKDRLLETAGALFKPYVIPDCSSEGIARHLLDVMDPMVRGATENRAWLTRVQADEDSKNGAAYEPDRA